MRMKHVTILGLDGASGTMIAGPLDLFYLAGRLWNFIFDQELTPYFDVEVANTDGRPIQCDGNLTLLPHRTLSEIAATDLILIPSILDLEETLRHHGDAIPWLIEKHRQGAKVAAMCTGTFFLAETGLLDYKTATTHWGFADLFRERRFKNATGDTPLQYLHRIRVEAAKRIIETQNCPFDDVAYQVGYENTGYFRSVFTRLCGIGPTAYRHKWGALHFPDSLARPTPPLVQH
jgi:transcriptional regulator GlxA family with amidase domain